MAVDFKSYKAGSAVGPSCYGSVPCGSAAHVPTTISIVNMDDTHDLLACSQLDAVDMQPSCDPTKSKTSMSENMCMAHPPEPLQRLQLPSGCSCLACALI